MTKNQLHLHQNIVKAMLTAVESHDVSFKDILDYWAEAQRNLRMSLSFCPDREGLVAILKAELE